MPLTAAAAAYAALGLAPGASLADVRRAHRLEALASHPDKSGDPATVARFRQVQEAYEALATGAVPTSPPAGPAPSAPPGARRSPPRRAPQPPTTPLGELLLAGARDDDAATAAGLRRDDAAGFAAAYRAHQAARAAEGAEACAAALRRGAAPAAVAAALVRAMHLTVADGHEARHPFCRTWARLAGLLAVAEAVAGRHGLPLHAIEGAAERFLRASAAGACALFGADVAQAIEDFAAARGLDRRALRDRAYGRGPGATCALRGAANHFCFGAARGLDTAAAGERLHALVGAEMHRACEGHGTLTPGEATAARLGLPLRAWQQAVLDVRIGWLVDSVAAAPSAARRAFARQLAHLRRFAEARSLDVASLEAALAAALAQRARAESAAAAAGLHDALEALAGPRRPPSTVR